MVRDVDLGVFAVKDFKSDLIFNMAVNPDLVQVTQISSQAVLKNVWIYQIIDTKKLKSTLYSFSQIPL